MGKSYKFDKFDNDFYGNKDKKASKKEKKKYKNDDKKQNLSRSDKILWNNY
jgi:hypothetical protein